jgi:hypothetical protein
MSEARGLCYDKNSFVLVRLTANDMTWHELRVGEVIIEIMDQRAAMDLITALRTIVVGGES